MSENSVSAEAYERWSPLPDLPTKLNLAGFSHTDEGIEVRLQENFGKGPTFILIFESPVAYRNINESYRLRTWIRLGEEQRSSLQFVRNSEWIAWLRQEAGGVLDGVSLQHYAIFTDEDCIEFVTEFPPKASRSE